MFWTAITACLIEMTNETFSEITCPLCGKKLYANPPRSLKKWKAPLIAHLIATPLHHLTPAEAEEVAGTYFTRLRYFLKLHQERMTEKMSNRKG